MICPNCKTDRLCFSSNFTYEECGYVGEGLVTFYECDNCGTTVEICVPDDNKCDNKKGDKDNEPG